MTARIEKHGTGLNRSHIIDAVTVASLVHIKDLLIQLEELSRRPTATREGIAACAEANLKLAGAAVDMEAALESLARSKLTPITRQSM